MSPLLALALFASALLAASAARADCQSDIKALAPRTEKVADTRTKQLVSFDLQRARRELAEGDEDECQEAVDHARSLLGGQ